LQIPAVPFGQNHWLETIMWPQVSGCRHNLLIGGDKTGNARWYEEYVPKADALFAQHLRDLNEK
jgi:hypothetical protein